MKRVHVGQLITLLAFVLVTAGCQMPQMHYDYKTVHQTDTNFDDEFKSGSLEGLNELINKQGMMLWEFVSPVVVYSVDTVGDDGREHRHYFLSGSGAKDQGFLMRRPKEKKG